MLLNLKESGASCLYIFGAILEICFCSEENLIWEIWKQTLFGQELPLLGLCLVISQLIESVGRGEAALCSLPSLRKQVFTLI